ncbi:polysaccharide deacetylase [Melghiribacillus thermohalophilus]|uniref:Polysaccharide deacetylase n=1 Tax=Melghiribacillus thermohalophilus TaxID=1324956 RepID=A0A4V2V194_9BACI|nr:polysaccharide deacetylase family protein [Melghiribacillus thermohalophilus]TCT20342.1 polysaccharide deacetylase [Melghiribacillus thermohalophilus]
MEYNYTPRLMELTSWFRDEENRYLIIKYKLHDTSVRFRWKVDRTTFDHLLKLIEHFGEKCRFQLSFMSRWNAEGNYYQSYLSVIQGSKLTRLSFRCSSEYAENLKWLAELQDLSDLMGNHGIEEHVADTYISPKTAPKKRKKMITALITVACASFISIHLFTKQSVFSQQPTEGVHIHSQNMSLPANLQKKQNIALLASVQTDTVTTLETAKDYTDKQQTSPSDQIFRVADGKVALTFDDGPSAYTEEIVQILNKHNVEASFFFVGNRVHHYKESVKLVHNHGYTIGIHGHTHTLLSSLNRERQKEEIVNAKRAIEAITGEEVRYLRPPYGGYNKDTLEIMKEQQLQLVQWNQDLKDWGIEAKDELMQRLHHSNPSGGIYVLHETAVTVEALDEIIQYLKEQGLILVGL